MRFAQIIFPFILVLLISSCSEKPIFSKKIEVKGNWNYNQSLSFPIEIEQLDISYDMIFSLTYGREFGYQNIYVKILTLYPNGKETEDILSLNLTNGAGIFLGNCNSSKCEIDILLQENFKFKEKGKYVLTIIQNGREENLENVYGAELKLFINNGSSH